MQNIQRPDIPHIDLRDATPVDLARVHKDRVVEVLDAGRNSLGVVSRALTAALFPVMDWVAWQWLEKTKNPYRDEIRQMAREVGKPGVIALNLSYEWGCTTGVFAKDGGAKMIRVLDWPYPKLGEKLMVVRQKGAAGEFENVTWAGFSGVFNAVAKGRFAAAINQPPVRRGWGGIVSDWARNHARLWKSKALPPAHLLRKVFEEAANYDEAKDMLMHTPLATPAIFVLSGTKPEEGVVIERLEDKAVVRGMGGDRVLATNHFESDLNGLDGWLVRRYGSRDRIRAARALPIEAVDENFSWFQEPIANHFSRVVMSADAATGHMQVMGVEGKQPVTRGFRI